MENLDLARRAEIDRELIRKTEEFINQALRGEVDPKSLGYVESLERALAFLDRKLNKIEQEAGQSHDASGRAGKLPPEYSVAQQQFEQLGELYKKANPGFEKKLAA